MKRLIQFIAEHGFESAPNGDKHLTVWNQYSSPDGGGWTVEIIPSTYSAVLEWLRY